MQSLSQLVQGKDHSRRGGGMPYDSEIADGHRDAQLCPPSNLAPVAQYETTLIGWIRTFSESEISFTYDTFFFAVSLFRR